MKRKSADAQSRVWIELERPVDNEDGHAQAAKLSRWLKAIGMNWLGSHDAVWWNERKQHYCFVLDEAGGFVEASDNGHWYLLDGMIQIAEKR